MNNKDFEEQLADYLGGELSSSERARFESILDGDPALRDEVTSLQSMVGTLAAVPSVDPQQAAARSATLVVKRRAHGLSRWSLGGLKYAAILLVGVGIGLLAAREPQTIDTRSTTELSKPPVIEDVHPQWVQAAIEINRSGGGESSLVKQLKMLSAARRRAM